MSEWFIMLGFPGSGRREVIADLIEGGFEPEEPVCVWLPKSEAPWVARTQGKPGSPAAAEALIRSRSATRVLHYEGFSDLSPTGPEEANFIVLDAASDPLTEIEDLGNALRSAGIVASRLIQTVHCSLVSQHEDVLMPWTRALIHFSDVVLLNRRDGVALRWVQDFPKPFEEECYPCLFEFVKKGRVSNPARILQGQPLRLSQAFDDMEAVDAMEFDEENLPEEPIDIVAPLDPYFRRLPGGEREVQLPDYRETGLRLWPDALNPTQENSPSCSPE